MGSYLSSPRPARGSLAGSRPSAIGARRGDRPGHSLHRFLRRRGQARARRYPDRYPAGATGQITTTPLADTPESIRLEKAARRAISVTGAGAQRYPDRYPAGATGQVTTTPLADTPESIRLEKAARRAISMTVTRSGALSETELMRQEHQPGHFESSIA